MTNASWTHLAHTSPPSYTAPPADWTAPEATASEGRLRVAGDEDEFAPAQEAAPSEGISRGPMITKGL